ncbi:hypothetical protein IWT25_02160 [Secundilactobacillus pentosiphilus]|uniref:Uncharacterized protein n=1 Tax=Secundilactobacillus pentosiphilus TaxID=1714682 RepID=A0A1Z5IYF6_9LACO|nr:hypothetical protein [Secundilactobacillus pentosiphilus]GAX06813.1 hypothetical protein IWT25_02160 [Secundilactobacillus pentosiphilus]
MTLLTYQDYTDLGFASITTQAAFKNIEIDAETLINMTTDNFYNPDFGWHDLQADLNSAMPSVRGRAQTFRRAIAMQCDFSQEVGASTPVGIDAQSNLTEVEIGRTTVQRDAADSAPATFGKTGLSNVVAEMLQSVGLMARAVHYR